jgi:hypothetical protein
MPITLNGSTGITAAAFDGAIDAADLTGTLPALNGAALTNLSAGNLTGALPAISGAALTNLPAGAPSTAQVGTATAGLVWGDVGSYGLFWWNGAGQRLPNATVAGSSLYAASTYSYDTTYGAYATSPSGTWRLMGITGYYNLSIALSRVDMYASIFIRIS